MELMLKEEKEPPIAPPEIKLKEPKTEERGQLESSIDLLFNEENLMRLAENVAGTRTAATEILKLCFEAKDWKLLNGQILNLSKKRGQLKQAVQSMVQQAMQYIDQTPDIETRIELIKTLNNASAGKIYVEIKRACLTKKLDKIKEDQGLIAEAVDLMQEVDVDTFGAMAKPSKAEERRLAKNVAGTRTAATEIMKLCFEAKDWKLLNRQILNLSKKHGQLKKAVQSMVQQAMQYIDQTPDIETRIELIKTLNNASAGKIYVEIERACLTKKLAKIKEDQGLIAEAAYLMQEVNVGTFGAMAKPSKAEERRLPSFLRHLVLFFCVASSLFTTAGATQLPEAHEFYPYFLLVLLILLPLCFFFGLKWIRGEEIHELEEFATTEHEELTASSGLADTTVSGSAENTAAENTVSGSAETTISGSSETSGSVDNNVEQKSMDPANTNLVMPENTPGMISALNSNGNHQINSSTVYVKEKRRFGDVVDGDFEQRLVSIKQIDINDENGYLLIRNEIKKMLIVDTNHHILRYHCSALEDNCFYTCVERFNCNLEELIHYWDGKRDTSSLQTSMPSQSKALRIKLCRDITKGIAHLHSSGIVHRDLRPRNIYIVRDADNNLIAKIGDLRISINVPLTEDRLSLENEKETDGWRSPEQITRPEDVETRKSDMFNLGCVFYFTLTGKHPLGKSNKKIGKNDTPNLKALSSPSPFIEAHSLITRLLVQSPVLRFSAQETLAHPMFWDSSKKIRFLSRMGSLVLSSGVLLYTPLSEEDIAKKAGCINWKAKIDSAHMRNLESRGTAYPDSDLVYLLRAVRNTEHHYKEYRGRLEILFPDIDTVFQYFDGRFPKLLMVVYNLVYDKFKTNKKLELEEFFN